MGRVARRFAAAVVALRWVIVPGWIAIAVLCVVALPSIREAQTGALGDLVPVEADAIDAEERSAELFAFPVQSRTQVVIRDPEGLSPRAVAAVTDFVVRLNRQEIPRIEAIAGAYPLANATGPARFAPERRTTIVLSLLFLPDVGARERSELADGVVQRLEPEVDGARLGVTGAVPARIAQSDVIAEHLRLAELATLAFVLLAVGLYTRSLVAPLVNVAAVAIAYVVSIRVVAWAGQAIGVSVPSEVEPVVVALLFGVVTDYVLFSVSRFRRRLADGLAGPAAARAAASELTPILTACGLAVAAGCAALIAAELGFLRAFGPGVAIAVLVALAVVLTFVPAMFALLGAVTLWPSGRPREPKGITLTERLLRHVVVHPEVAIAGTLVVLLTMGAGVAWLQLGQPLVRGLPADNGPHQAYRQLEAGFAPGVVSPTVIVVEQQGLADRRAELRRLQRLLAAQPGVAAALGPATNPTDRRVGAVLARDGDAARYVLYLDEDPYGGPAVRDLDTLQARLPGLLRAAGIPEAEVGVAGDTALARETIRGALDDLPRVLPVVLLAIGLVLVVFLRSLVAPLYLVAIALLAPLAATGLTVAVFQGLLGQDELSYFVPIAGGVLLVALGSDYNVFLVGRIWAEARTRRLPEAIVVGGAGASRAISAAGLVLAASFAAIALVPILAFRELAFLVAAGLIIDAFLVRSVLVPGVIALVGERSAWPGRAFASETSPARRAAA